MALVASELRRSLTDEARTEYGDPHGQFSSSGEISRQPPRWGGAPSPPKMRRIAPVNAAIAAPNTARRNIVNTTPA